jgi:hypothetical protein
MTRIFKELESISSVKGTTDRRRQICVQGWKKSSLLASVTDGMLASRSVIQTTRNYHTAGISITLRLYELITEIEMFPNSRATSDICWRDHKKITLYKLEGTVGNLVSIVLGVMTMILCEVGNGITLWMECGEEKDLLYDGIITEKRFWTTPKVASSISRAIIQGGDYKELWWQIGP